jgi:sulfide:quinone oxidoreductase
VGTSGGARVVILGGGFAGLRALHHLARHASVTLVDARESSLAKPALPEVALAGVAVERARFRLAPVAHRHGARFVRRRAERVDPDARVVLLEDGEAVPYDFLVVALGAVKDYDAVPGYREVGHSVCDDVEAPRLAAALDAFRGGPVVVGSAPSRFGALVDAPRLAAPCEGPVGEVAFLIDHELRRRGLRDSSPVTIFSPGTVFFEDVGDAVRAAAAELAGEAGVEVLAGRRLAALEPGGVRFEGGESLEAALVVLVPPYAPPPLVASSELGDDAGYLPTDRQMRHLSEPRVFGAGDATALAMPKLGHIAVHQADVAAAAILQELGGRSEVPPYAPEVFCIMDRGGAGATLILSDVIFGGTTDLAWSNPLARLFKWTFDTYYLHTRGHLPPATSERLLVAALRARR